MKSLLKTIIIDDDLVATEQLKSELAKYSMLNICGNAYTGADGRNLLLDVNPDLIFLDVELPDCMGFDLLHSMRSMLKKECNVIFFTAYNKYIIKALREKAFDFLLKPIDQNELSIVLGRVLNERSYKNEESVPLNTQIILNTAKGDMLLITSNDISFFAYEEKARYWMAFLCNGEKYALKRSTKSDNILSFSDNFKMTDKSHIINIHSLVLINDGHCIMKPPFDSIDNNITISKTKLLELRNKYPSI
jgi:two-component system LytT family response regulator